MLLLNIFGAYYQKLNNNHYNFKELINRKVLVKKVNIKLLNLNIFYKYVPINIW